MKERKKGGNEKQGKKRKQNKYRNMTPMVSSIMQLQYVYHAR